MKVSFSILYLLALFSLFLHFQLFAAAPAGRLGKRFSSLLNWNSRASSKTPQSDGNLVQFEDGYLVETVVKGNELGVVPHKIRVSQDGELVAVDASSSNVVRITPPLSQYCRARLVAGSFKGHTGHVDGKPSDARFNNPRGVAMDDRGNVYVADVSNLAIRKIGESGVTTIAGGKSNSAGYRDGPSDEAQFSNDFDVIYVQQTCSLLIVDRGNAAIRQISLYQEDCDYQQSSVSAIGVVLVVIAVVTGYFICTLQQGLGSTIFSTPGNAEGEEDQRQLIRTEKVSLSPSPSPSPSPVVEMAKEDNQVASSWQLILDLAKLSLEAVTCIFALLNPLKLRSPRSHQGLTPLKDSLVMPEDNVAVVDNVQMPQRSPTASINRAVGESPVKEVKPVRHRASRLAEPPQSSTRHHLSREKEYQVYYYAQTGEAAPPSNPPSRSRSEKSRRKDSKHVETNGHHSVGRRPGRREENYYSSIANMGRAP